MIRPLKTAALGGTVILALVLSAGCTAPRADKHSAAYAAWSNDVEGVRNALAAGIDLNSLDNSMEKTPLMAVAANPGSIFGSDNHELTIARMLIEKGADVGIVDKEENTALLYAARTGKPTAFLKLLIDKGADVNAVNTLGRNALLELLCNGHMNLESVRLLLNAASRTDLFDIAGLTALEYAERYPGTEEIQTLLAETR